MSYQGFSEQDLHDRRDAIELEINELNKDRIELIHELVIIDQEIMNNWYKEQGLL
jgi:hypothetical protein